MSEDKLFIEYEPTDDSGWWRMERPDLLEADFGVGPGDVSRWHRFIVRTPVWEFARRLYQTGGVTDSDPDILRSWTRAELAAKHGIGLKELEHDLGEAVKAWKIQDARDGVSRQASIDAGGVDEIEKLLAFANSANLSGDIVDRLLQGFGFDDVKGGLLRAQIANRILSLREYLESQHSRASARQLIRYEISLHAMEKLLLVYTGKIEELLEKDPTLETQDGAVQIYRTKSDALDKEIRNTTKAHGELQKQIGADELDMTTRKRLAVETIGFIMTKCMEWESDPESVYMDGVFTAAEVNWQLDPLGERLPQYRPDIVLRLNEALKPENLWDPDYKPAPIQVRVAQELVKLAECMRAVPEDAPPIPTVEDDEEETVGANAAVMMPSMEIDGVAPPVFGRAPGKKRQSMGVFT